MLTPPQNILVALDLDGHSRPLLEYGRMLADRCGAALHVLHVVPECIADSGATERRKAAAFEQLRKLVESADPTKGPVTVDCAAGPTAYAITRYAVAHHIDLIVMGTHWHGPSFQMATGSIAETVLGRSACPVLAVTTPAPSWDIDPAGSIASATHM